MPDLYRTAVSLLYDPIHTRWIAPVLIICEAILCFLIVLYVPYTEIDYKTYLAQVHKYLYYDERNYAKLTGPTGPLVYPAVHVWIYSALYYYTTVRDDKGDVITILVPNAQIVFAGLYLFTLAVVIACYRRVNAPPWLLVPLVLSKRLHSIFMLRLFNDAWAAMFMWVAIYTMLKRYWHASALVWSLGIGVKMTVLLAAPAVGVLMIQALELPDIVFMTLMGLSIQIFFAIPFLEASKGGDFVAYLKNSFNFGRSFLFKWTVNWRFVGEDTFLSKEFAGGLLVLHISLLLTFIHMKWVRVSSSGITSFIKKYTRGVPDAEIERVEKRQTPIFVMDTVLGSMMIGLLCARSLHYQFYAYIGWATPYLLWRSTGSIVVTLGVWAAQEWSWLVFPSTDISSMVVVGCLAVQVVGALIAQPVDGIAPPEVAINEMQNPVESTEESQSEST